MSVQANFVNIYLRGLRDRSMLSGTQAYFRLSLVPVTAGNTSAFAGLNGIGASTIFVLVLGVICAVGVDSRDPMVSCLTVRSFMKRLQSGNSHCFFYFCLF